MRVILFFIALAIFTTCSPKNDRDQQTSDSLKFAEALNVQDSLLQDDEPMECPRSQAEPVTKKDIYPNTTFKLDTDSLSGTEIVELDKGERLVITNTGCEYYILTFRFESDRYQADTTDLAFWMDKAAGFMEEVEEGIDSPIVIKPGALALRDHAKQNKPYSLTEQLIYHDNEMIEFVTLERVQKLNDKRFAVEVSYGLGPL